MLPFIPLNFRIVHSFTADEEFCFLRRILSLAASLDFDNMLHLNCFRLFVDLPFFDHKFELVLA